MKLRVSIEAQADMDAIAEFIARDSLATPINKADGPVPWGSW